MFPVILLITVILAFIGIGLFLVIGTLRRVDFLVRVPEGWFYFYPYWFLKKSFGEQSVYYFHIFIGMVFILGGIGILLYAVSY